MTFLSDQVLKTFASQIEYLHSAGSDSYDRFYAYRQTPVLAIGSGPILLALVAALFESGLSRFHILITDTIPTERQQLANLTERARRVDSAAGIEEVTCRNTEGPRWREAIRPFHTILYVSPAGEIEELRALHAACRLEKKILIPALFVNQTGLAGPLVHPDSDADWESAWRRIHRTALGQDSQLPPFYSSTAGALLANVVVSEHFKTVTGMTGTESNQQQYWLNAQTYEGDWHSFIPHPLVTGQATAERITDIPARLEHDSGNLTEQWFDYFKRLTSERLGIFHTWEEGDLNQLPLSQCRVQVADLLTDGPTGLLPDIIIAELTHEKARREAGLAGIEAHVARIAHQLIVSSDSSSDPEVRELTQQDHFGIGAGHSMAEGICRGLLMYLNKKLGRQLLTQKPSVQRAQLTVVEDECCRFYVHALTLLQGTPEIGLGEDVAGFPVMWVGSGGHWHGSIGLNRASALRRALVQALQQAQNKQTCSCTHEDEQGHGRRLQLHVPSVHQIEQTPITLEIPHLDETPPVEILKSILQVLEQNRKRLLVYQLILEPFLKNEPILVFGVLLREEMSL